ncbi:serine/threonine-protein kinase S6KL [Schistocerca gregaria]|uniref:serine/threonine-protein kinase S6KL n=1 Tax=Schistocerca gregaria TaxID=7010 RepID=UPI00211DDA5E|nr:serine/threonine-protein kinase S6KL [Schistocerca gregaria]
MGNINQKKSCEITPKYAKKSNKSHEQYSSEFSLSSFVKDLSGRSFVSATSQQSTYSVSRPWSRVSRRRWNNSTLTDPLEASKTAWPVPYIEAAFLPEFKIKGDVTENSFEVLDTISSGAFGKVYLACKRDTNQKYALKILSKSQILSQNAVEQVKDEVRIQSVCGHHPFIVNCPYFWQNRKRLFIVTDYIAGGELLRICQDYGPLPEELVRVYVAEIALALDFLHNAGIIYRDLKLENLLLDEEGHLKLIDFGLAKWLKYGCRTTTICGTIQYMAPDIVSMEPYGHAVDWWSLGVIMCCLLTGEYPAPGLSRTPDCELAAPLAEAGPGVAGPSSCSGGGSRAPGSLPPGCALSHGARALLIRLLEPEPRARLRSLLALQQQPFFKDFSFVDARSKKFHPLQILEKYFPDGPVTSSDFVSDDTSFRDFSPDSK